MKIVAAQARLVRLEFTRPVRTARGEAASRDSVIFTLRDAEGRIGCGESAPWPGFGTESAEESLGALEDVAASLTGSDVEPGDWPTGLAVRLRNASAARAAVQGALWDLAARRAGRPLADHLAAGHHVGAGPALRTVAVHALLLERDPEALRAEAARAREAGFRAAKLKLGAAVFADDLARARAARAGLGAGILLRGDANGAWSEDAAMRALSALAPLDFDYVEQPLVATDIDGLARLRDWAPVRVAVDESVATEAGAMALIGAEAADVFVLKPATLGGPARALEIATLVRRAGADVVFSHAFESAVGARHVLHCAAAWGQEAAIHGLCTSGLFANDLAEPVACEGGRAAPTIAPGLGITP